MPISIDETQRLRSSIAKEFGKPMLGVPPGTSVGRLERIVGGFADGKQRALVVGAQSVHVITDAPELRALVGKEVAIDNNNAGALRVRARAKEIEHER